MEKKNKEGEELDEEKEEEYGEREEDDKDLLGRYQTLRELDEVFINSLTAANHHPTWFQSSNYIPLILSSFNGVLVPRQGQNEEPNLNF